MTTRILIIGGYGNFGSFIATRLAQEPNIQLILAGRNIDKARAFAQSLTAKNPIECASVDIYNRLSGSLAEIKPDVVIHTSGPYQNQPYKVAQACLDEACHYIDLADARDFVCNINRLDKYAKRKSVMLISGASSVPCLANAIINHYRQHFAKIESIDYAIATAQLTNTGLATTSAGLSYAGKAFTTLQDGKMQRIFGWRNLRARRFWGLGNRLLGNCDIPDLTLFPAHYPELSNIRFQAGLELKFLHLMLWLFSGLVKCRLCPNLQILANLLLKISRLFDPFGKDDSGFYMTLEGTDQQGDAKSCLFEILARHGDGLYIPSMPAIILSKKIAAGSLNTPGAYPCLDLISLDEYLTELGDLDIKWRDNI